MLSLVSPKSRQRRTTRSTCRTPDVPPPLARTRFIFSLSVAALVQAGQILATGSQDLFRQTAEANRLAFTGTLVGIRAVAGTKTVKERIELQANLFRTSAIWAVSQSSRFARASIDLTERASAPLKARAVATAEEMTAPKA